MTLAGRVAKNKKRVRQPLPPLAAGRLRDWLAGRAAKEPVWPRASWADNGADMLRFDMKAAGVPEMANSPDGPARLDFHALRHSYVSALAAAGVGLKELQELARHSDPRLTLGVYTHSRDGALAESVGRLEVTQPPAAADLPSYEELALEVVFWRSVVVAFLVAR